MPEIFTYSSNIGAAKIALAMGVEDHKWFLKKMGQLDRLRTELPESAEPLVPKHWGELNTVTIAFGHGLVGRAAAGGDGDQRAGQRRLSDPADLPEAHPGGGDEGRQGVEHLAVVDAGRHWSYGLPRNTTNVAA